MGAGYGSEERSRLERDHGAYAGLGTANGPESDDLQQAPAFALSEVATVPRIDAIVKTLLALRDQNKFPSARIDRCVWNYCERSVPHPEYGCNPEGQLNGMVTYVLDPTNYTIGILRKVLAPDGTLVFSDDRYKRFEPELQVIFPTQTFAQVSAI